MPNAHVAVVGTASVQRDRRLNRLTVYQIEGRLVADPLSILERRETD